jgi:hypothetical protein
VGCRVEFCALHVRDHISQQCRRNAARDSSPWPQLGDGVGEICGSHRLLEVLRPTAMTLSPAIYQRTTNMAQKVCPRHAAKGKQRNSGIRLSYWTEVSHRWSWNACHSAVSEFLVPNPVFRFRLRLDDCKYWGLVFLTLPTSRLTAVPCNLRAARARLRPPLSMPQKLMAEGRPSSSLTWPLSAKRNDALSMTLTGRCLEVSLGPYLTGSS